MPVEDDPIPREDRVSLRLDSVRGMHYLRFFRFGTDIRVVMRGDAERARAVSEKVIVVARRYERRACGALQKCHSSEQLLLQKCGSSRGRMDNAMNRGTCVAASEIAKATACRHLRGGSAGDHRAMDRRFLTDSSPFPLAVCAKNGSSRDLPLRRHSPSRAA